MGISPASSLNLYATNLAQRDLKPTQSLPSGQGIPDYGGNQKTQENGINLKNLTSWQKFYYHWRDKFQIIFRYWDKWNGGDAIVSKDPDLKNISDGKDGDEKEGADFLRTQTDLFNALDIGRDGGTPGKDGDRRISTYDLESWLTKNDIFGTPWIVKNRQHLRNIADCWDYWNGKDTIVTKNNVRDYSVGKNTNDLPDELKSKSKDGAKFLLDNPDFFFYLDILGGQKSSDGKIGKDYFDYHDGLIGSDFKQNDLGNCSSLAALGALTQTREGAEDIANSISVEERTGDYLVNFKGDHSHKTYRVTRDEASDDKWAKNDQDMRIMNVALDKYAKDHPHTISLGESIYNGFPLDIMDLVTNEDGHWKKGQNVRNFIYDDDTIDKFNKGEMAIAFGACVDQGSEDMRDPSGEALHGFFIKGLDKKNVTYVNPWNARKEITIGLDDFCSKSPVLYYIEFDR